VDRRSQPFADLYEPLLSIERSTRS